MALVLPLRFRLFAPAPLLSPINTIPPLATGTATNGSLLTSTQGTWTGLPTITYTYQWCYALLDESDNILTDTNGNPLGVALSGKTSPTYTIESAYVGGFVFCIVTATNSGGSTSADSNTIGRIT